MDTAVELKPRASFHKQRRSMLMVCWFETALVLASWALALMPDPKGDRVATVIAPGLTLMVAGLWVLYFKKFKPMALTTYKVFADRVLIVAGASSELVPFSSVIGVLPVRKWGIYSSFGVSTRQGKTYRIPLILEKPYVLLDAVLAACPGIMAEGEAQELLGKLVLSDQRHECYGELFRGWRTLLLIAHPFALALPLTAALYLKQQDQFRIPSPGGFYCDVAVTLIYPALIGAALALSWAIQKIEAHARERIKARQFERDREFERLKLRSATGLYGLLLTAIFAGIYAFDLNTLHREMVVLGSADEVWIDGRTNCLRCQHPLGKGDIIVTSDPAFRFQKLLGKITALPGEKTTVTAREKARFLATVSETTVPDGSVAIEVGFHRAKVSLIVPETAIKGRAYASLTDALQRLSAGTHF